MELIAPTVFAVLSTVFFLLALGDERRGGAAREPIRQARLRIAIIFGVVSAMLFTLHVWQLSK